MTAPAAQRRHRPDVAWVPGALAVVGYGIGWRTFAHVRFSDPTLVGLLGGFTLAFALTIVITPLCYGPYKIVAIGLKVWAAGLLGLSGVASIAAARLTGGHGMRAAVLLSPYELAPVASAAGFALGFIVYECFA